MEAKEMIRSIRDLEPLFMSALSLRSENDPEEFSELVSGMVSQHQEVANRVFEKVGIDETSDWSLKRNASVLIARLIAREFECGSAATAQNLGESVAQKMMAMIGIAEAVEYDAGDEGVFGIEELLEAIGLGEEADADDMIIYVKMHVMGEAIGLWRWLNSARASEKMSNDAVSWMASYGVGIARSVACQWNKRNDISDREKVFVACLPSALRIASDNIRKCVRDAVMDAYPERPDAFVAKNLFDTFDGMDMGYKGHPERDLDWLRTEVSSHIAVTARELVAAEHGEAKWVPEAALTTALMKHAEIAGIGLWKTACEDLIERVENMSDEQYSKWEAEHGDMPMPIEGFLEDMSEKMKTFRLDDSIIKTCKGKAKKAAYHEMALLWGLSDAYCKLKFAGK